MIARPTCGRSKAAVALIAAGTLVIAAGAAGAAHAASAPIYKCRGDNLTLIYTDSPCKGGERLDIHPGEVDPGGAARLQVASDQLDRSAAARAVEARRAAARRELAAWARYRHDEDIDAQQAYDDRVTPAPYDYSFSWYPGFVPLHLPARSHHRRSTPSGSFAPRPPHTVPRS
jgi:hypothetical protein